MKQKPSYEIITEPAINFYGENTGYWYRIVDNKGRLITLYNRHWLNSNKIHSVTETANKDAAIVILDALKSGKHNEDRVLTYEEKNLLNL